MPLFGSRRSKSQAFFQEIPVQAGQWLESQTIVPDQDVAVLGSSIVGGFTAASEALTADTLQALWGAGDSTKATALGQVFSLVTLAYLLNNFEVQQAMEFEKEVKEERAAILLTALGGKPPGRLVDVGERMVAFRDEIDHYLALDRQIRYTYWSEEATGNAQSRLAQLVLLDSIAALKGQGLLRMPLATFPITDFDSLIVCVSAAGGDIAAASNIVDVSQISASVTSGFRSAAGILRQLIQS